MEQSASFSRPLLKTKGFSTFHIQIFELILLGKTNREINRMVGYSQRSHLVVDHSKKVMYKLLCSENLCKKDCDEKIVYPRKHLFWWKRLLEKHREELMNKAIKPEYYSAREITQFN